MIGTWQCSRNGIELWTLDLCSRSYLPHSILDKSKFVIFVWTGHEARFCSSHNSSTSFPISSRCYRFAVSQYVLLLGWIFISFRSPSVSLQVLVSSFYDWILSSLFFLALYVLLKHETVCDHFKLFKQRYWNRALN